jgi:hypothetical protein
MKRKKGNRFVRVTVLRKMERECFLYTPYIISYEQLFSKKEKKSKNWKNKNKLYKSVASSVVRVYMCEKFKYSCRKTFLVRTHIELRLNYR